MGHNFGIKEETEEKVRQGSAVFQSMKHLTDTVQLVAVFYSFN